jgi:hypothetical protein
MPQKLSLSDFTVTCLCQECYNYAAAKAKTDSFESEDVK